VAVQVLISLAVILDKVDCTAILPLHNKLVELIVFILVQLVRVSCTVTAQVCPFTDVTHPLHHSISGCSSKSQPIARNTNWSTPFAVRVRLVPKGFVIPVQRVIV
jgi:hypothetical protein